MGQQAINDSKGLTLKKGKQIMYEYGLGISSKAILVKYLGETNHHCQHPYDSQDLMRCIGLIRVMKIDINIMRDSSYIWNRILRQWDTLVDLCLKEQFYQASYLLQEIRIKEKTSFEHVQESNFIISINRVDLPEGCDTSMQITKNKHK
jgi:hypothetical protein